jgi:hypothetical protein
MATCVPEVVMHSEQLERGVHAARLDAARMAITLKAADEESGWAAMLEAMLVAPWVARCCSTRCRAFGATGGGGGSLAGEEMRRWHVGRYARGEFEAARRVSPAVAHTREAVAHRRRGERLEDGHHARASSAHRREDDGTATTRAMRAHARFLLGRAQRYPVMWWSRRLGGAVGGVWRAK